VHRGGARGDSPHGPYPAAGPADRLRDAHARL
jgi:hypothetical protein